MPMVNRKKVSSKKYVPDSMATEESDIKFRKKGLQDKMNRAPEFNKAIAKRNRNPSVKV